MGGYTHTTNFHYHHDSIWGITSWIYSFIYRGKPPPKPSPNYVFMWLFNINISMNDLFMHILKAKQGCVHSQPLYQRILRTACRGSPFTPLQFKSKNEYSGISQIFGQKNCSPRMKRSHTPMCINKGFWKDIARQCDFVILSQ